MQEVMNGRNVRTVLAAKWEGAADDAVRECADGIGAVELEDGSVIPALFVGRYALAYEESELRWRALPTRVLGERPSPGGGAVVTVTARPVYCQPDAVVRLTSRAGLVTVEVRRGVDEHASASLPAHEVRRLVSTALEGADRDALMVLVKESEERVREKARAYVRAVGPRAMEVEQLGVTAFVFGYQAALMELLRMTGGVR